MDDYWFNASNLYWISSKNGQKFFLEFLSKIEERVELLRSNINFKFSRVKTKSTIEFEDKSVILTPLELDDLLPIFEMLGYETKHDLPKNLDLPIRVSLSWSKL